MITRFRRHTIKMRTVRFMEDLLQSPRVHPRLKSRLEWPHAKWFARLGLFAAEGSTELFVGELIHRDAAPLRLFGERGGNIVVE